MIGFAAATACARALRCPYEARGDGVESDAGVRLAVTLRASTKLDTKRECGGLPSEKISEKRTLELPRGSKALWRRHGGLPGEDWKSFRLAAAG